MPIETNPEKFERKWKQHIDQLAKLGWSLSDEDFVDFVDACDEMREFVDKATEELENEQN